MILRIQQLHPLLIYTLRALLILGILSVFFPTFTPTRLSASADVVWDQGIEFKFAFQRLHKYRLEPRTKPMSGLPQAARLTIC